VDGNKTIGQRKSELRSEIRARLAGMTPQIRAAASMRLREQLEARPEWKGAGSVLFYAPIQAEPDIWPLIETALAAGKVAALPRFSEAEGKYQACRVQNLETDVVRGQFGIREPVGGCAGEVLKRPDLILVPGVGFDSCCRRLGRGKGYYDQILAVVEGRKCGVGFDEQIVDGIPLEPHDIALDCILTPTRWIEPSAVGL
jgi:5-formyltetrahydrofolate cyclo-ligase